MGAPDFGTRLAMQRFLGLKFQKMGLLLGKNMPFNERFFMGRSDISTLQGTKISHLVTKHFRYLKWRYSPL